MVRTNQKRLWWMGNTYYCNCKLIWHELCLNNLVPPLETPWCLQYPQVKTSKDMGDVGEPTWRNQNFLKCLSAMSSTVSSTKLTNARDGSCVPCPVATQATNVASASRKREGAMGYFEWLPRKLLQKKGSTIFCNHGQRIYNVGCIIYI